VGHVNWRVGWMSWLNTWTISWTPLRCWDLMMLEKIFWKWQILDSKFEYNGRILAAFHDIGMEGMISNLQDEDQWQFFCRQLMYHQRKTKSPWEWMLLRRINGSCRSKRVGWETIAMWLIGSLGHRGYAWLGLKKRYFRER
jgi:hypothetical protein